MNTELNDRLNVGDAVKASLIITAAAAAIAIGFTAIAILKVGEGLNPFRRR